MEVAETLHLRVMIQSVLLPKVLYFRLKSLPKSIFDGDTCSIKGVFTDEANAELKEFINDKKNFIGFGCKNIRSEEADVVQSLYNLTKILNQDESQITKTIKYS